MKKTLLDKYEKMEIDIQGNWYAPARYLRELKNVVQADYIEQCSSAGDWTGFFIVKYKNNYYLYIFSQENNYPSSGFTLRTGKYAASSEHMFTEEEVYQIITDY